MCSHCIYSPAYHSPVWSIHLCISSFVDRQKPWCLTTNTNHTLCHQHRTHARVHLLRYVTVFWWLSGFLNTCAYVCAPERAPAGAGPRAGALMALLFQLSSLLALLLAEGVQVMMFQKSPGAA